MKVSTGGGLEDNFFNYNNIRKAAMVLRALNHPLRQKIFNYLSENSNSTVSSIIQEFNLEQSVISQHLAILRRAKIIYSLKNGKFVHYFINNDRVEGIHLFVNSLLEETKSSKVIELLKS